MANDNTARDIDRAWELMKKIGFAMLVTRDGDKLRARPMSAYLERENNAIYFLTDVRRHKDDEIARNPNINLSFADASDQKYVSVSGTAVVSNDRAKIKELFSTPAKAWWDSGRRSEHPRAENIAGGCRVLGFAGHRHQLCEDGGGRRHRHAAGHRRKPQGGDLDADRTAGNPACDAGKTDRAAAGRAAGQSAARDTAAGAGARRTAAAAGIAGPHPR